MIGQQLLARAKESLKGRTRQKSVTLRRAISDSYYALFHTIAKSNADALIGVTNRTSEAWSRFYRAINHGQAKTAFESFKKDKIINNDPLKIQIFQSISRTFIDLQEARHNADYNPVNVYKRRRDVETFILSAENAISKIKALNNDQRKELAALLLTKDR